MKIKVTLADGKVLEGVRYWYDMFADGWGNTTLHKVVVSSSEGEVLSQPKGVRITNRWIVMIETLDGEMFNATKK